MASLRSTHQPLSVSASEVRENNNKVLYTKDISCARVYRWPHIINNKHSESTFWEIYKEKRISKCYLIAIWNVFYFLLFLLILIYIWDPCLVTGYSMWVISFLYYWDVFWQINSKTEVHLLIFCFFHSEITGDANLCSRLQLFSLNPPSFDFRSMRIKIKMLNISFWSSYNFPYNHSMPLWEQDRTTTHFSFKWNSAQCQPLSKSVFSPRGIVQHDLYTLCSSSLGHPYLKTNKLIYFKSLGLVGNL